MYEEEWRPVERMSGYEVSNLGRLRRKNRSWPRHAKHAYTYPKPRYSPQGYVKVHNSQGDHQLHRLVLEAFVGPCPPGKECDHINRRPGDNQLWNLRWVTHAENMRNQVAYVFTEARRQNLVKARAALARKHLQGRHPPEGPVRA